ncbi:MAG: hypothetical protein F6K23_25595 [Okeania sp. SIO2C9]|uniref:hypothetical protein n=1 Tax=Okeania sp. SIO2C9 TaxID=2607791 RepID=UPI0013C156EB|nr:hypothetical protein [Okeania sp. SIO2C9]NEQ76115.1 hypothetical protein [Okeania sp. SIO2C9]
MGNEKKEEGRRKKGKLLMDSQLSATSCAIAPNNFKFVDSGVLNPAQKRYFRVKLSTKSRLRNSFSLKITRYLVALISGKYPRKATPHLQSPTLFKKS